ncbi:uncharacterized protein BXIN_0141 [Babesia sp. Xinjiang]|uniref:uncharacterized protein n=1 Tax=Babesia sp. Xinjiang TaxID=462227 RepID=UPI000A22ED7F|nr:uncharacterized protein BXIN_0141 [Babesia sp. Xinjiang]ORM39785.1 hypothetical protein BXIN_0141 [Babesia sp. Xinjiang]
MRRKKELSLTARDIEVYNDAIDQLKSINIQVKSPGEYVASRLESVALDDIRRELKALLASCQSNASGLLMSLFASAVPFNETLESTIQTIVPFKEVLESSLRDLDTKRGIVKQTKCHVKLHMCRYVMVVYAKLALTSHLDAVKHLNNIAEEIIDSFEVDGNPVKTDAVQRAIGVIEDIIKRIESGDDILQSHNSKYNLATNWALFEIIPKEINGIHGLLKLCKHCETEVTRYLQHYSKMLKETDNSRYKSLSNVFTEHRRTNVERVLEMEGIIDWSELAQFRMKYDLHVAEDNVTTLQMRLEKLTVVCAENAMTMLFNLYSERERLFTDDKEVSTDVGRLSRDINTYVSGLSSLIKGAEHLWRSNNDISFVVKFRDIFVKPIMDLCLRTLIQRGSGYAALSPQEEAHRFSYFVDKSIKLLLHPKHSITMQFLNDISRLCGNDTFKVVCVFDAIAAELLVNIEKRFSAIYFPIYLDRFMRNLKAYERLLEHIEMASGSYHHYLKWRGSTSVSNISRCFSIGVVCDNFIECTTRELIDSISSSRGVGAKLVQCQGQTFYLPPSMVLYRQLMALFSHEDFFYHLMPQYLMGASDMMNEYVGYVRKRVSNIESAYVSDTSDGGKASEAATDAAYVLHDLDTIESGIKTGNSSFLVIGISESSLDSHDCDHLAYLMGHDVTSDSSEAGLSTPLSESSGSTGSGMTTSTNISDQQNAGYTSSSSDDGGSNGSSKDGSMDHVGYMVCLKSKVDGEVVNLAVKRLEYPLHIAFKRLLHVFLTIDRDSSVAPAQRAISILSELWVGVDSPVDIACLSSEELSDVRHLVSFTKKSVELLYNFFNAAHEQIDVIKYTLENFIIQNLVSGARCSLQFLQSLPSKFRTGNKQDVSKPSNYVKYMLVPLLSFKEFTASSLPPELSLKIMTQTVARLSMEYREHLVKLVGNVLNLNRSLSNAKGKNDDGARYLIADIELVRAQLNTDIQEYLDQCEFRLGVPKGQCEDLNLLVHCVDELLETT